MELRDAHHDLLNTLIDDMEPFNAVVGTLETPLAPREAIELLLELEGFGMVSSAVLVDLQTWRRARPDDFERAIAELEGRVERPFQSDLWFRLSDAGKAEWRTRHGEREPRDMWRIAQHDDVLEVSAVSKEIAAAAVAEWQLRNPEVALEQRDTKTPAPFTLADGTRVEPGVLVTFRRRRLDARRLS